jgi:hypothetical protein
MTVNMNQIPILEFSNNEVYGATARGLAYWWIGTRDGDPYDDVKESVIKDFRAWNIWNYGVFQYPSNHVVVDGLVLRNDAYDVDTVGFLFGDYSAFEDVITNADIQGFWIGISMPSFADSTTIENSYLENRMDILVNTPFSTNGTTWLRPKTAIIDNVVFAPREDGPFEAIVMNFRSDGNAILQDQVFVYNYDGVAGDNFQVYYLEQAPDYVVPQTDFDHLHGGVGSPEAGLTNQQNWLRYGIAIAGAITPTEDMRPDIEGFVRAI